MTELESAVAALQSGDAAGALSQLDALLARTPDDTRVGYVRAVALARLARLEEALAAARDCLRANPGDAATLELLERLEDSRTTPIEMADDPERYVVGEELARGGMGRILAARGSVLGRPVAIKEVLDGNADLVARFQHEARVTARLQHPGIVPVYGVGRTAEGRPYYAMKLVAGRSFDQVLADAPTLSSRLALLPNLIAVVDALAYAHGQRVLHRNLKPANVLCGDFGETVVVDWGLAKGLDESEEPGRVMGTPVYMSPEQARGEAVDARTDVYALGAMLYQLLAGVPPYHDAAGWEAVLARVLTVPPAPLTGEAPAELRAIVSRAMAREQTARYPTAKELAQDLRRFQTGQLVGVYRYSLWELVRRWLRRHRAAVAVGSVALLVLVAGGILSVRRIVRERDRAEARRLVAEADRWRERDPAAAAARLEGASALAALPEIEPEARRWHDRQLVRVLPASGPVLALAASADGRWLVAGDGTRVSVWDAESWQRVAILPAHAVVTRLAFAADGARFAVGESDGSLAVYARSGTTWSQAWEDRMHDGPVTSLAWHVDGERLITGSEDGRIAVLRARDTEVLAIWKKDHPIVGVSGRGRIAAFSDRQLHALDPDSPDAVISAPVALPVSGLGWWIDEIVLGLDDGRVLVSDGQTQARLIFSGGAPILRLVAVDDAAARVPALLVGSASGQVRLIDGTGSAIADEVRVDGAILDLAWLRGRGLVAVASGQPRVEVRRVLAAPRFASGFHLPEDDVTALAIAADGRVAVGLRSGEVLIGDRTPCGRHAGFVRALAWTADGKRLASGGADGVVQVRATDAGCGPATSLPEGAGIVSGVAFRGNDLMAAYLSGGVLRGEATSDPEITQLAVEPGGGRVVGYARGAGALEILGADGKRIPLEAPDLTAYRLAWQPGGTHVALATAEGRLVVADVASGRVAWEHRVAGVIVADCAWRGDGSALLVGLRNGRILVFTPGGELVSDRRTPLTTIGAVAWSGDTIHVGGSSPEGAVITLDHPPLGVLRDELRGYLRWTEEVR